MKRWYEERKLHVDGEKRMKRHWVGDGSGQV